jgi:hypothetical protein
MKYLFYTFCLFVLHSCKDSAAEFNNKLVSLHSQVQTKWLYVAESITNMDSISSKEMSLMQDLQDFVIKKIDEINAITPNREGRNFKKAIIDQMNYLIESCKSYKRIFGKENKKFTKQEANEWLQNSHERYLYYDNAARDAQEEFADMENKKLTR